MRITVWESQKLLVSIDPLRFTSEKELLEALKVQSCPDQEFQVRLDDGDKRREFFFDGSDGLDILAVLCHRGMVDVVLSLEIPARSTSRYMRDWVTPEEEILLVRDIY